MADIDKILEEEVSRRGAKDSESSGKLDIDVMLEQELANRQGKTTTKGTTLESQFKQTLPESMQEGVGGALIDATLTVPAAAVEVGRGVAAGASDLYDTLDSGATLIANLTGAEKGGMFEEWANRSRSIEASIPPTEITGIGKTIYNLAGELPSIHLKYAGAGKVLEGLGVSKFLDAKGLQSLGQMGEFAFVGALDEYGKTEEYNSLASGALKGATVFAAFGAGAELFKIGTKLLWKAGRSVTKKWIQTVTGDKQLANDFVKNPNKYNGDVIETSVLAEQDTAARRAIRDKYSKAQRQLDDEIVSKKNYFKEKNIQASNKLRDNQTLSKESLNQGSATKLKDVMKSSNAALTGKSKALKEEVFSTYDDVAQQYNLARKEYGEAVGNAVNMTVKQDASKSINSSYINKNFNKAISSGPFRRTKTVKRVSVFSENIAGADKAQIKQLEGMVQQYEALAKEGKVSVKYLQNLKNHTNDLATKYYKSGDTKLATMYSDISKSVNPAKIVEQNPILAKDLKFIAKANIQYSKFMKGYENAINVYYTRDANGALVPDIDKGIRAIAKNDLRTMSAMRKADAVLPEGSKMVPKLKKAHSDMLKFETEQGAVISSLRKKIKSDKTKLFNDQKKAIRILDENKSKLSNEEYIIEKQRIRNLHDKQEAELDAFNDMVVQRNITQERLRKIKSITATDGPGLVQRALFYGGGATSLFPGSFGRASAPMLGASAALSPAVTQAPGKVFSKPTQASLESIIGNTVKSRLASTVKEVAAQKINK